MKVFRLATPEWTTILLFGLGLIGEAVSRALQRRFQPETEVLAYDWLDATRRRADWLSVAQSAGHSRHLVFLWCGGIEGFASDPLAMARETAILAELIAHAETFARDRRVDFHMMSSAGGLFEGQTQCVLSSDPAPLCPYGIAKLAQERHFAEATSLGRRLVYRPTSVYGTSPSRRAGLISALVANAMSGQTTRISGSPHTLRDYVLADDIGEFVSRQILGTEASDVSALLLSSGRPSSIYEIIERVRELVPRPLFLQFDPSPSNGRNMSFLRSAFPTGWRPTELSNGISRVVTALRTTHA
ncbi:NAD-dependent epimerase/dehydratase family protein [Paracoccus aminophilus]|uniref:UDP-glucose 4-epimerase n=1 Tax=Paracoccus aminophilus JCM 7686 TaxID=1367847 RepID=S5Y6C2_PARAH|nr:NAD-dependent epimerase/dehydratase family protein [Paracoccus aminophilus]AGT11180.1 UDP-glucose 4-epimerase [Paracoccus aminophilus JCM 7686]